jgi:hypothetical protein
MCINEPGVWKQLTCAGLAEDSGSEILKNTTRASLGKISNFDMSLKSVTNSDCQLSDKMQNQVLWCGPSAQFPRQMYACRTRGPGQLLASVD